PGTPAAAPAATALPQAPNPVAPAVQALNWLGRTAGAVGHGAIRALEWGPELTANYVEASFRTIRNEALEGNWGDAAWAAFRTPAVLLNVTDEGWREEWEKSVDAKASVFQTMWAGYADITDPANVDFDRLIDDPEAWGDRQDYFSSGTQRWVTGVGDALWQVFADPTLVGAKFAGIAKGARGVLKADEVAKVGAVQRGEAAAETLTRKERHFSTLVQDFAMSFEKSEPGQVASAAQTKWLKNTRDGGAIAYMMRRAGEGIDDVAERVAAREEVLLAGMGDKVALGRLTDRNAKLAVEMRRLDGEIEEM